MSRTQLQVQTTAHIPISPGQYSGCTSTDSESISLGDWLSEDRTGPTHSTALSSHGSGYRLTDVERSDDSNQGPQSLAAADGGLSAWLFLTSAFIVEALIWGFSLSFGVFLEYFKTHGTFQDAKHLATVGTTATGLMYTALPVATGFFLAVPCARRWGPVVGIALLVIAMISGSFAETVNSLIVTQGVVYGIGGSLVYAPTMLFLNEWFVQRMGLAIGVTWAGTGLGGVVIAFILQWMLNTWGFPITLRIWAVIYLVLLSPLLFFIKPRLPPSRVRNFDFSFLLSPAFLLLQLGNVIQAMGYFLPGIYLPTYARSIGASDLQATLTVVIVNVSSIVGNILVGRSTDKWHVTTCIMISTVGSSLGTFLCWGFATSLPMLYVFCVIYGIFACSYSATWAGAISLTTRKVARAETGMVFGFLSAGRGLGNIISGPLSEALLKRNLGQHLAFAYGSGYGTIILFTGICSLLGGVAILGRAKKGFL